MVYEGIRGPFIGNQEELVILRGYKWKGELLASFTRPFGGDLAGMANLYLEVMILGFPIQNMGDMDLPFPVARYEMHVDLSKMPHLFSSTSYSSCIPLLKKSSIMCESL